MKKLALLLLALLFAILLFATPILGADEEKDDEEEDDDKKKKKDVKKDDKKKPAAPAVDPAKEQMKLLQAMVDNVKNLNTTIDRLKQDLAEAKKANSQIDIRMKVPEIKSSLKQLRPVYDLARSELRRQFRRLTGSDADEDDIDERIYELQQQLNHGMYDDEDERREKTVDLKIDLQNNKGQPITIDTGKLTSEEQQKREERRENRRRKIAEEIERLEHRKQMKILKEIKKSLKKQEVHQSPALHRFLRSGYKCIQGEYNDQYVPNEEEVSDALDMIRRSCSGATRRLLLRLLQKMRSSAPSCITLASQYSYRRAQY